jgi:nicotinamidase-related amidase
MFTAMDAFLRNYRVWVPVDCVAAETQAARDRALRQLRAAAKVWTGSSKATLAAGVQRCAALHK